MSWRDVLDSINLEFQLNVPTSIVPVNYITKLAAKLEEKLDKELIAVIIVDNADS